MTRLGICDGAEVATGLRIGSPAGRWTLAATILGSAMASVDATVVGIALPAMGRDLDASLTSLQWVVSAYLMTLAGLLLVGGALGDRYGRRRVFTIGVVAFAAASLLCALAPDAGTLTAARALQGAGGALLTPASLAILQASFAPGERARAIGAWSGLGGVAAAVGPFLGGWLVQEASWRLVFLINLPLAGLVLLAVRHVPETRDPHAVGPVDLPGGALATAGLGAGTYGLLERSPPMALAAVVLLAAFVVRERRTAHPLVPLELFGSRQFAGTNLVTFVVYGALGGMLFLLPVQLQQVSGYGPLAAGAALLPLTAVMLALSSQSGSLAARIGPRLQMSAGPVVVAVGMLLLRRTSDGGGYGPDVLPAVLVLGLGLAATVAPLTSTALDAAPDEHSGIASAVNNDVARAAGLLAVALLPAAAGISGFAYADAAAFDAGFDRAMALAAGLCAAGGVLAAVLIRNPRGGTPAAHAVACPLEAPPPR